MEGVQKRIYEDHVAAIDFLRHSSALLPFSITCDSSGWIKTAINGDICNGLLETEPKADAPGTRFCNATALCGQSCVFKSMTRGGPVGSMPLPESEDLAFFLARMSENVSCALRDNKPYERHTIQVSFSKGPKVARRPKQVEPNVVVAPYVDFDSTVEVPASWVKATMVDGGLTGQIDALHFSKDALRRHGIIMVETLAQMCGILPEHIICYHMRGAPKVTFLQTKDCNGIVLSPKFSKQLDPQTFVGPNTEIKVSSWFSFSLKKAAYKVPSVQQLETQRNLLCPDPEPDRDEQRGEHIRWSSYGLRNAIAMYMNRGYTNNYEGTDFKSHSIRFDKKKLKDFHSKVHTNVRKDILGLYKSPFRTNLNSVCPQEIAYSIENPNKPGQRTNLTTESLNIDSDAHGMRIPFAGKSCKCPFHEVYLESQNRQSLDSISNCPLTSPILTEQVTYLCCKGQTPIPNGIRIDKRGVILEQDKHLLSLRDMTMRDVYDGRGTIQTYAIELLKNKLYGPIFTFCVSNLCTQLSAIKSQGSLSRLSGIHLDEDVLIYDGKRKQIPYLEEQELFKIDFDAVVAADQFCKVEKKNRMFPSKILEGSTELIKFRKKIKEVLCSELGGRKLLIPREEAHDEAVCRPFSNDFDIYTAYQAPNKNKIVGLICPLHMRFCPYLVTAKTTLKRMEANWRNKVGEKEPFVSAKFKEDGGMILFPKSTKEQRQECLYHDSPCHFAIIKVTSPTKVEIKFVCSHKDCKEASKKQVFAPIPVHCKAIWEMIKKNSRNF